jgi:hypothetical protein
MMMTTRKEEEEDEIFNTGMKVSFWVNFSEINHRKDKNIHNDYMCDLLLSPHSELYCLQNLYFHSDALPWAHQAHSFQH